MWIEVFRTGTWTDSSGKEKTWTEEDLDTIISKYDPANHEAPIVIGHPKDNAPAYGWVESLKRDGAILSAKIKPTVNEFVDWVKQGLYKKISISLYGDNTLRHVGFLGGVAPAVKGLSIPEFSNNEFSTYELTSQNKEEKKEIIEKKEIKEGFIMDEKTFKELEAKVIALTTSLEETKKAETAKGEELETLRKKLDETNTKLRRSDYEAFCEQLIGEGKLLPAEKQSTLDFMEIMYKQGEHEFSEGGKKSSLETYKESLKKRPKLIEFDEVATKNKAKANGDTDEKVKKLVSDYMTIHKDVTEYEAMRAVCREHPEFREVT